MENKQFCKRVIFVAEFKRFLLCFGKGRKNTSSHCGSSSKFFQEKESPRESKVSKKESNSFGLNFSEEKRIEENRRF